jgi:TolA-binding protein
MRNTTLPTDAPAEPNGDVEPGQPEVESATDDTLGEPGKAALDAERKRAKELDKQLREATKRLQQIEDAGKSDLEKTQARVAELEKNAAELLQLRAAITHKIPNDYLHLLTATDEDGLAKQAETIAKLVTAQQPQVPTFAPNPGQGQHQPSRPSGREQGKAEAERRFGKPATQS